MNRQLIISLAFCISLPVTDGFCQQEAGNTATDQQQVIQKKKMNFFIVSKRKKGKLDLATRYNVLRSKFKAFFCRKQLVAIVASDTRQACDKISQKLGKNDASLGTIWFDSHGMYKKGYSLFFIGKDEISYISLKDSVLISNFEKLSPFADSNTRLVIGSCYGGATYNRSSIDYKDTTRMNGDSLMIAIGNIIRNGKIYASESWVMTKPGLFRRRPSVGGFPGRKLFRDVCYEPAWKNMGVWNQYDAGIGTISKSNPVSLDRYGNLIVRGIPYEHERSFKKSYHKKLTRLQSNLYK
jgi:hypothetical protein